MAVVSHLVCSSSDAIGDILIAPISNLRSAPACSKPCHRECCGPWCRSPSFPAFSASPQRETESAFGPGSVTTQVFCAAVAAALRIFYQFQQEQTLQGHTEGQEGVKELDLPLTSAMQMPLVRCVMESGACFSCCFCDQHEQNIRAQSKIRGRWYGIQIITPHMWWKQTVPVHTTCKDRLPRHLGKHYLLHGNKQRFVPLYF